MALNLTCANRVILVDQWWNSAAERQAFGRVHRIGQKKPTYFVKILTKNTIDERLADMQAEKDKAIAATLREDEAHKPPLTLEEIMRLFGHTMEDELGEDLGEDDDYDHGEEVGSGEEGDVGGDIGDLDEEDIGDPREDNAGLLEDVNGDLWEEVAGDHVEDDAGELYEQNTGELYEQDNGDIWDGQQLDFQDAFEDSLDGSQHGSDYDAEDVLGEPVEQREESVESEISEEDA